MGSKNAGEDHANHPPYAVAGKHIEGIINAGARTPLDHEPTDDRGNNADNQRVAYGNKTSGRCNGNQAYDHADTNTYCGGLLAPCSIEENPCECSRCRCSAGGGHSRRRQPVRAERRPRIEPEPTEPKQSCAEHHIRDSCRIRTARSIAPFEVERRCQGGYTRRHMHNRDTGRSEEHTSETTS